MIGLAGVLFLAIGLANGQLNFEGNPLTEYTDYTAEESNLSEKTAREKDISMGHFSNSAVSRPQRLYPVFETSDSPRQPIMGNLFQSSRLQDTSARQLSTQQDSPIDPEVALNVFLNSKTPEESRVSLDYFLRSQGVPSRSPDVAVNDQEKMLERIDTQANIHHMEQRQPLHPHVDQIQLVPPQFDQQRQQLSTAQNFAYAPQPAVQPLMQPVIRTPTGVLDPATMLHPVPVAPSIQLRNDMIPSAMWRQRMKRLRAKPLPGPVPQPRIGPMLYKGPVAVPYKAPVEMIYTKPPGFHRAPMNPPGPYEDANTWFPDANYPPPSKDLYYSQLYTQSYDPHYYNYIATTGKIHPYLYGKLGKRKEEQDNGIWSELYHGFTKHGLKNIMTPTFLLGMTLPVVTLMLSALVQKRSIARADARDLDQEDALREYLERLQRAMRCYGSNRAHEDGC